MANIANLMMIALIEQTPERVTQLLIVAALRDALVFYA
jgi:hypothetical protein